MPEIAIFEGQNAKVRKRRGIVLIDAGVSGIAIGFIGAVNFRIGPSYIDAGGIRVEGVVGILSNMVG